MAFGIPPAGYRQPQPGEPEQLEYKEAEKVFLGSGMKAIEISRQLRMMAVFKSAIRIGDRYFCLK